MTPTLWHYTCSHAHELIRGLLWPGWSQFTPLQRAACPNFTVEWVSQRVWLTDLDTPVREALGLTSGQLNCDRTEHRYRVIPGTVPIERYLDIRRTVPPGVRYDLESADGAMPAHWWLSGGPVQVVYDPNTPAPAGAAHHGKQS